MYRSIDASRVRNLKVVAMLKQGQKLRTRLHHFSIDDAAFLSYNSFIRLLTGESRGETIDSITRLVNSCVHQVGLSPGERQRLADQFKDVLVGLDNLAVTYKDDCTSCAGLELIRETIEDFISQVDPTYERKRKLGVTFDDPWTTTAVVASASPRNAGEHEPDTDTDTSGASFENALMVCTTRRNHTIGCGFTHPSQAPYQ